MKSLLLFTALFTMSCEAKNIEIIHYNIKELASPKLTKKNEQLKYVQKILKNYNPDLLFINELQYDIPGAPNDDFTTDGENLAKLRDLIGFKHKYVSFYPANTGKNAKKNAEGEYYADPNSPGARDLADQVNFGTIPHQYSSGLLTKFPIVQETVVTNLKWKDFNRNIDLTKFKGADGSELPKDMELFDKNFLDVVLDIHGKKTHVIVLHTVPSYHFGNKFSPNYERNRDQLRFLEWYLTGKTDIDIDLINIQPITGKSFIAAGDWNVDPNSDNPGANVLKRIFTKTNPWIKPEQMTFTNEGGGYGPNPFRLMLDYLVSSKDLSFSNGKIMLPNFERQELGCGNAIKDETRKGFVKQTYQENGKECAVLIHQSYIDYKNASDHYPIYGELKF
jgi:hypothetical protein